jgi:cytosine deaminase
VIVVPPPSPGIPRGSSAPRALLLRGPRLADGQVADVLIVGGTIVSVGREPAGHPPSAEILDLRGYLLLPSLVEPHTHLGSAAYSGLPSAGIAARARASAARHLACGTTAIRVHVDVGEEAGLRSVHALLDVRADLAGIMDIQIVAVTSTPVTGLAGVDSRERLRRALAAGADLAGAAPVPGDETGRAVEVLAVVAADAGAGLDLHIDKTAAPGILPRLIAVAEAGFGRPIAASHVVSLGLTKRERRHAARSLAEAGIGVVALPRPGIVPSCGGSLGIDTPRGLTAVRDLVEAGVPVAAGGDSPHGLGHTDPLETASLLLMVTRLTPIEALTAVTSAGRQIMRLPDVTVSGGSPADLVAIRTEDLGSALASGTPDRIVLRGGRIVARTQMAAELALLELRIMRSEWNLPRSARGGLNGRP